MSTRKSTASGKDRRSPDHWSADRSPPHRAEPVQRWLVTDAWEPSLLRKLQQAEPRLRSQR